MIYENHLLNTIKKTREKINKKYNCTISQFNSIILKKLLYNINCHIVSVFKDYMIYDYIDEYLRRFYLLNESSQRLPKFSQYYKNYIDFFCKPMIKNLKLNEILQEHFEKKAEYYYKKNYGADKLEEAIKGCNSSNNEEEEDNKIKVGTIFSNSIKKNIDNGTILTNTNNTTINLLSNEDTIELYTNNEEKSNDNTVRDIINEIYYKKDFFQRKKDSFRKLFQLLKNNKKKSCNYKKLKIETIHNIVKKNSLSNLNLNDIFKKNKNIYPSINNYLCKKIEKSNSKSKSHSRSKSNIISNKSLSKSKNKNKLPVKNNKTRNLNSNTNLKKNKTTINNNSKRKNLNIYSTNSIHSITKSKEDLKLLKTQNLNKLLNNLYLSYNHASFDNNSKKILNTEHNLNKRKSPNNNIKPVTKIQKHLKFNNYFISKSRNNNNGYMSQQILNLLTDSNHNYLRKKNYTNSNLNINSNNHKNSLNKNKHLKDYLNKKISHNENVSMNIRNNLKYLSNINYKSIIPSFSQVNEKLITSYQSKNSNKLIRKNRPFSNVLKKYKSKSKSKEK